MNDHSPDEDPWSGNTTACCHRRAIGGCGTVILSTPAQKGITGSSTSTTLPTQSSPALTSAPGSQRHVVKVVVDVSSLEERSHTDMLAPG